MENRYVLALALAVAAFGLSSPEMSHAKSDIFSRSQLSPPPTPSLEIADPGPQEMVPHDDLKSCSVKSITLNGTEPQPQLILAVDCAGEKTVTVVGGDMDRLKMFQSLALSSLLSDAKVSFRHVLKFVAGTEAYAAAIMTVSK